VNLRAALPRERFSPSTQLRHRPRGFGRPLPDPTADLGTLSVQGHKSRRSWPVRDIAHPTIRPPCRCAPYVTRRIA